MALPMLKEFPPLPARPEEARLRMPPPTPEMIARARELEQKLGHPLRQEIDRPLTDEELEEVALAHLMSEDELLPVDDLLRKYGRR